MRCNCKRKPIIKMATQWHVHACVHAHTHTHERTHSLSHTHTHSNIHICTLSMACSCSLKHTATHRSIDSTHRGKHTDHRSVSKGEPLIVCTLQVCLFVLSINLFNGSLLPTYLGSQQIVCACCLSICFCVCLSVCVVCVIVCD